MANQQAHVGKKYILLLILAVFLVIAVAALVIMNLRTSVPLPSDKNFIVHMVRDLPGPSG